MNDGSIVGESSRAERKALEKRRAILRAAAVAFRKHGFLATGMREIASAADLSPANLYYYFDSKQELLYFCQDHSLDRLLEEVTAAKERERRPADVLRQIISAHARFMLDELDGASAHLEVDALAAPLRARIVEKRDRYEQAVRKIISNGMKAGAFVKSDAALITRAIFGALNWTARWYRPDGPAQPSVIAEAYAEYLVRGLLK